MKKLLIIPIFLLVLVRSVWAQTTVTIGTGTLTSTATVSSGPVYVGASSSTAKFSRQLAIYKGSEITAAGAIGGNLTKISWYKTDAQGYTLTDATFKIYIRNTPKNTFPTSQVDWATEVAGATLVYSNTAQTFNTAIGWQEFILNTPYAWNGSSNLEIMVEWSRLSSSNGVIGWQFTPTTDANAITSGTSFPATSARNSNRPNIKLVFAPNAGTDAGVKAIASPFSPVQAGVSAPVQVTIGNFGTNQLTAATINWKVNSTVGTPVSWNGSLTTNQTDGPVTLGNYTFSPGNHTVKAWTSNPNGGPDAFAINDTATINILACNAFLSGTYTINKGAPASATNFTSFSAATQVLGSCGISGPVTFNVVAGSGPYNEQVVLPEIPGTSATNTVTFEGNGNILTALPTTTNPNMITFSGADFTKINNLIITVDPTAALGWGVQLVNASDNNTISNCTINIPITSTANTVTTNNIFNGIVAGSALATPGDNANNLKLQNNIINGGMYGIQLNGLPGITTGNQVIGNQIRDPYQYGIYISDANGTLIEGNDISRPTRVNGLSSGVNLYGIYLTGANINTIVSKNKIHNTNDMTAVLASGIQINAIFTNSAAPAGSENIIRNNLIYNINNNGGWLIALANSGGSGTYYYHNTISADNPALSYYLMRGVSFSSAATNLKFINNIISFASAGTNTKQAIYLGVATGISLLSNNNDLYIGSTGNIGALGSANKATLADWQAANPSAPYDLNSVSVNPAFANLTSDLTPTAVGLNNTGQPLPSVTEDFAGATRSTTTPDPGAYEFTPPTYDAGITAILSPGSLVTPGVLQQIEVTLKNFAPPLLTTATIGWSINGVVQTSFPWSGSLTQNASSATINIGSFTFPAGNYTLKVWSASPNGMVDGVASNDTTTLNIVSCAGMAGAYTINKNNPTAGTNFQSFADATQRLNSCGVSGPVTFTVVANSGPYNEQVEILHIPYASATNTVTFEGSGNTVLKTGGVKLGAIILDGARYVKVNNFVITTSTGSGVQLLNAADFNTISNNTINLPLATTSQDANGILAGTSITATGNYTSNSKFENNIISGGYCSIRLNGNAGGANAANNQILGNQLKDMTNTAIYVSNANGTLIEGNDISRPTLLNPATIHGIYLTNATMNTVVSKNRIHNTHDMFAALPGNNYGIFINASATPGNENIVKNNVMYNLNAPGMSFHAFYNYNGNGAYYYNNTVLADSAIFYTNLYGLNLASGTSLSTTNVKFINNIISFPGMAQVKYAIYVDNTGTSLVSDYNNLHLGNTGVIGWYGGPKTTLADWQFSNMFDQHSVSSDPIFMSAATGNLKPLAGLLDNLGQPLVAVTDDILGVVRPAIPDFGAYEFSIPANDVSITAISGPRLISGCGLSGADTITVTIKNFGTATQTAVPVSYSVDGISIATETYTGSIAPNATVNYTFTATANLANPGPHVIIAKTLLTGDLVTGNDADTLNITNSLLPALPVAFDFETPATGISRFRKVVNPKSNIMEDSGASNGTGSAKGMIMDGVTNSNWITPAGVTDPWTTNTDNFSGAYMCISPAGGAANDSLLLIFDLKQLYKSANTNTNFRVTVNGTQIGTTYRPPFSGTGGTTNWTKVKVDLSTYKNDPFVMIGLESSVSEAYANGSGTANLIDNINIMRVAGPTGVKENELAAKLHVFPNPSTGLFHVNLENGREYELKVTDLTGKILLTQKANGNALLKLENQAKGIYLLTVSGENGISVRKLIVQ